MSRLQPGAIPYICQSSIDRLSGDSSQSTAKVIPAHSQEIKAGWKLKIRPLLALITPLVLISNVSHAGSSLSVTPFGQLSIAQKEHDFDELLDQSIFFYMLHLGGGIAMGDAYVGLNAAWSINDATVSEEEETGEASRSDYDITLGYNLNDYLTVFGGYKLGETDIDFTAREVENEAENGKFSDNYQESGPYLGLSWQYYFDNSSKLSVAVAYAWLDAENDLGEKPDDAGDGDSNGDSDSEADEPEFDDFSGRVDSDATGYSIGVRWSIPLSDQLSYYALFRLQRYDQDLHQQGSTVSITEQFTEMGMGLSYIF